MSWKLLAKAAFVFGTTALAYFDLPVALFSVGVMVLAALYDKADSLIELSFGPLKAKLERSVSESEKLLSGLRSLALAQSKAVVAAASSTGRFASDDAWIFHTAKEVENGLRAIGVSEDELIEARSALVSLTLRDLGATATNGSYLPSILGDEAVAEWQELRKSGKLSDLILWKNGCQSIVHSDTIKLKSLKQCGGFARTGTSATKLSIC